MSTFEKKVEDENLRDRKDSLSRRAFGLGFAATLLLPTTDPTAAQETVVDPMEQHALEIIRLVRRGADPEILPNEKEALLKELFERTKTYAQALRQYEYKDGTFKPHPRVLRDAELGQFERDVMRNENMSVQDKQKAVENLLNNKELTETGKMFLQTYFCYYFGKDFCVTN